MAHLALPIKKKKEDGKKALHQWGKHIADKQKRMVIQRIESGRSWRRLTKEQSIEGGRVIEAVRG